MTRFHGFNGPAENSQAAWKLNCFSRLIPVKKLPKIQNDPKYLRYFSSMLIALNFTLRSWNFSLLLIINLANTQAKRNVKTPPKSKIYVLGFIGS